jgi:hypothetical protein
VTTVRIVAAHEVVARAYPRPPPEDKDEVAMATGTAIDGTVSRLSYELRNGRSPSATSLRALATTLFDDRLAEASVTVPETERTARLEETWAVVQAFRRSGICGFTRPRSRLILIGEQVGVYAQPDFWDGRARFYEMKSYRAVPPPPDIALQLRLFQLAFPRFEAVLVCFDRHVRPVETLMAPAPPLDEATTEATLRLAWETGLELGTEKVLEYLDAPTIRYPFGGSTPAGGTTSG